MLTQERLKDSLSYNHENGIFTWIGRVPKRYIGRKAGHVGQQGYRRMRIDGDRYMAHRLAFLFVYGIFPEYEIDHKNGNRDDNRIENLRQATRSENGQNQKKFKTNTSGFTGVSWCKYDKKWNSRIRINGKLIHLGYFKTAQEAGEAYLSAKKKLHTFNPTQREM